MSDTITIYCPCCGDPAPFSMEDWLCQSCRVHVATPNQIVNGLLAELDRLTAENKRLAGEADAMKVTTKDGARIRPTVDQVWLEFDRTNNNKAEPVTKGPWQTTPGAWSYFDGDWYIGWGGPQYDERLVSDCYSTEAAALAARKGEQPA